MLMQSAGVALPIDPLAHTGTGQRALADGRSDDMQGRLLIERVFAAEQRRNIARTMMLLRMYRVLTPEQRVMLAAIRVRPFAVHPP
jgi:Spy/CpxP family protein refolding chaperone